MNLQSLTYSRKGGETKRFHTWPTLQEQNVAAHSHGVAMICAYLASEKLPGIGVPLLMAALTHDLAEWEMGDLPAPTKRAMPDYPLLTGGVETFRELWNGMEQEKLSKYELNWEELLTDQEKRWLKLADAAEGCFRCIRERAMGNQLIIPVWKNFIGYVYDLTKLNSGREAELHFHLLKEWTYVNGNVPQRIDEYLGPAS